MGAVSRGLAMAACALVHGGTDVLAAPPAPGDWTVDTSWLSYVESDDRVSVSKSMGNLSRTSDAGALSVSLVHDTMSGASPTGAIRTEQTADTYSGASGGSVLQDTATAGGATGASRSRGRFEDRRVQAGVSLESEWSRTSSSTIGAVVSQESDYDSFGASLGLAKERADKSASVDVSVAYTVDTIQRADGGDTPEPLGEVGQARRFEAGQRQTLESRLAVSRVLNRRTIVQAGVTLAASRGYHSDPYKVVSVTDANDRLIMDLHDSRPESRLRTSIDSKLVHQIAQSTHSFRLGYRHYRDDWGIVSNTLDVRYRHTLTPTQYLEPHLRFYRQGKADFLVRSLSSDDTFSPILPGDGLASADYRLDAMSTATLGIKYGISVGARSELRLRAEVLDQRFQTVDDDRNRATVFQMSFKHRF